MTADRPAVRRRPLPEVDLELGPWVPGWGLRAVLALMVLAAGTVAAPSPGWAVMTALAAVTVAVVPQVARSGALVAGFAALLLLGEPGLVASAAATAGAHLTLVLGRWACAVPPRGRVEVAVMRRAGPAIAVVQVLAQGLVLLAWVAAGAVGRNGWLAVVALLLVAAAALAGLRTMRRAATATARGGAPGSVRAG